MLAALAALLLHAAPAPARDVRGTLRVDTVESAALGVRKRVVIWLPPSYRAAPRRRYPVVYYLHGLFGDETNWTRLGHLDATLDSLVARGMPELIVVMPDADDGWYTTWSSDADPAACRADTTRKEPAASFCVAHARYDDYVARDLVRFVDRHYRTRAERRARGVAGLSMGGYGAVLLALRHPGTFGAAASHSGLLAPLYEGPHPFAGAPTWAASPDSLRAFYRTVYPSMRIALGADSAEWWRRDPSRAALALQRTRAPRPALYLDVGVDDPYRDQTLAFRAAAEPLGIPVTYAEWPGGHSWAYWRTHAAESLAWFAARLAPAKTRMRP
jgi:putative tributyrin esterase